MKACDVLVVGAGPTGLVLALWLTKLGAGVRIVDKTAEPGTTSRALAIQARTLELYRQLDLAETVLERAHKVAGVNLWARGEKKVRLPFEDAGVGLTPFPSLRIFPQDEHEHLLIDRLGAMGVLVERRTELVGFNDEGDRFLEEPIVSSSMSQTSQRQDLRSTASCTPTSTRPIFWRSSRWPAGGGRA